MRPMSSVRLEKVAALVRRELSTLFQLQMTSMLHGIMVTVTRVRISPDLGVARVYLSFFPVSRREEGMQTVNTHIQAIRRMLGERAGKQLRKIPELHFHIDDSLDYFEEIDRLLKP